MSNLDWGALYSSYLGLFLCAAALIAISLFALSLTSHTLSAFLIALLLNFLLFYGLQSLGSYQIVRQLATPCSKSDSTATTKP